MEARDRRIKLLRLVEPQPSRTIGLAWRRTSPRKCDFIALGEIVTAALGLSARREFSHGTVRRRARA
jgi:LysR family hydrogen peroxide-inducible transcriptional activator